MNLLELLMKDMEKTETTLVAFRCERPLLNEVKNEIKIINKKRKTNITLTRLITVQFKDFVKNQRKLK